MESLQVWNNTRKRLTRGLARGGLSPLVLTWLIQLLMRHNYAIIKA